MTRLFTSVALFLAMIVAGCTPARAQGLTAEEAVIQMKVENGFEVQVVASEPLVRQPQAARILQFQFGCVTAKADSRAHAR